MGKSLTVRISDKLEKQLEATAKRENIPVSDLVRSSLERFLAVRRFHDLRGKVLPFAESQGLLTDEDIFKIVS
jgi:predicted transcriptional regulator